MLTYFGAKNKTKEELEIALDLDGDRANVEHAYKLEEESRANRTHNSIVDFSCSDKLYFTNEIKIR